MPKPAAALALAAFCLSCLFAHAAAPPAAVPAGWLKLIDQLGIRDKAEGVALRATFIVDPDNTIQHVSVNNLNVGRNPEEVLRILDGLQTDELCPCNRTVGGDTL